LSARSFSLAASKRWSDSLLSPASAFPTPVSSLKSSHAFCATGSGALRMGSGSGRRFRMQLSIHW
jgi:hypothetical protein